jgi:hypothetical protein
VTHDTKAITERDRGDEHVEREREREVMSQLLRPTQPSLTPSTPLGGPQVLVLGAKEGEYVR